MVVNKHQHPDGLSCLRLPFPLDKFRAQHVANELAAVRVPAPRTQPIERVHERIRQGHGEARRPRPALQTAHPYAFSWADSRDITIVTMFILGRLLGILLTSILFQ